jgi:hypothetical protein
VSDVLADDACRARYSGDASLYRLVPAVVVRPRDANEVEATLAVARGLGVPVLARGAGAGVQFVSEGEVVGRRRSTTTRSEAELDERRTQRR